MPARLAVGKTVSNAKFYNNSSSIAHAVTCYFSGAIFRYFPDIRYNGRAGILYDVGFSLWFLMLY